ncbi:hypothetical protein [Serratia aquatilis]
MHLGDKERVVAIALFGLNPIDESGLSTIRDYLDNPGETEDETGLATIINAMCAVSQVSKMHPEGINNLLLGIFAHFENQNPTEQEIDEFIAKWVSNPGDREKLVKSSRARSESNNDPMNYTTLSMHTMLSIMGVHPLSAKPSDVRNAKEMMESRDPLWRGVDKTFRVITGILDVDTDTRHAIIADGLKNLEMFNDDQARLHFVKLRLAGNPACPELADYGQQVNQTQSQTAVKNLGGGKFSVDGLAGEQPNAASNELEKQEAATTAPITDEVAQQSKETLDQLGYGVYGTDTGGKSEHLQRAEKTLADANGLVDQLKADDFQQRAAQVEQTIAEQPKEAQANLDIWKRVMRTDPRYTKPIEGAGFIGTSINSEYMFMRATEVFGPIGTGWGYTIVEEKMFTGAPMSEAVFEGGKIVGNHILRDADGSILCEQNHSLQIEFWYVLNGKKGFLNAYGATPYIYKTKRGFMADSEVMKKSLTDAIKKSLSMLGFSADVFLGWHDLAEYREENATEFAIRNASDKAEDVTRLREELDEKLAKVAETISSAVTVNEAAKVHASIAREVETHRKAAEAKGDMEHAKYLAGRLRRLTTLKDERIATLSKSEENAQ